MESSKIGYRQGHAYDASRRNWSNDGPRPIRWHAWYTASPDAVERPLAVPSTEPLFLMGTVARDAPINEKWRQYPVVLLSHGTGGTATSLGWIARALAAAGYVVIGVDHHGNTASEPYRPEGFLCWWERPRDLSVALDSLANEGFFAGRLDTSRVACVGFSLGGYTAVSILGAITDMDRFNQWAGTSDSGRVPREFPGLGGHIEPLLRDSAVFRTSWERQSASCADPRVRVVVALAPAPPVRAFTPNSLAEIAVPVTVLAGEADREAPIEPCAMWLAERLPRCKLHSLGAHVGHYTLLCAGTEAGRKLEPELCIDLPGVDRQEVHKSAVQLALQALAAGLPR